MRRLYTILRDVGQFVLDTTREILTINMDYLDVPGVAPWWRIDMLNEIPEGELSETQMDYLARILIQAVRHENHDDFAHHLRKHIRHWSVKEAGAVYDLLLICVNVGTE